MTEGCRFILETDGVFSTHSFHLEKHRELTNALGEDPVRVSASKILALLRCSNLKRGIRVPKLNSKLCYQDVTYGIFIIAGEKPSLLLLLLVVLLLPMISSSTHESGSTDLKQYAEIILTLF